MVPLCENQFQMLNVTNRSWKFGVDGREGMEGLPLRNEPCFSSGFILFPSSLRHWSLLLILKLDWRMNAAYYIKYQRLFSCLLLTIMFGVCSRLVIKLQGCESNKPFICKQRVIWNTSTYPRFCINNRSFKSHFFCCKN